MDTPPKGYFRLFPGNEVRLRYGFVIKCKGARDKDASGNLIADPLRLLPRFQVGHARSGQVQGQGQHPLGMREARLPGAGAPLRPPVQGAAPGRRRAQLPGRHEPGFEAGHHRLSRARAQGSQPEERFQFERHGYFVADAKDSTPVAPVFNRAVTLRDSWGKHTS